MPSRERLAAIILTLFVWSLAGALFGGLFIGLYETLQVLGLVGWQPLVLGAVAAAMTTAAFYSAMPVALVGTTAGVVASIGYLIASQHLIDLPVITTVSGLAGLAAGGFYAWIVRRTARPLAETLTGLLAGLGAGLMLAILLLLYPQPVGSFVMAAGVVALVGALFQLNEHWIVQTCQEWLPATIAAPLVAGLIAAVVGASIWLMAGSSAAALNFEAKAAIDHVLGEVPSGSVGGMLGGAITGLVLELLGFHLEDREKA